MAVIAVQPELGANPCVAAAILSDAVDKAVGEAGFGADVCYLPVILWLGCEQ